MSQPHPPVRRRTSNPVAIAWLTFAGVTLALAFGVAGLASAAEPAGSQPSASQPSTAPYLIDLPGFLRDLRTDRPELAPIRAAIDKGDFALAGRLYVAHFRKKSLAFPLWTDWAALPREEHFDTAKADGLLAGHLWDGYSVYEIPPSGIDWRKAPLTCLTRFPIFPTLLDAAHHTRNAKYPRFIVDHTFDYMKNFPMAEFVGKGSFGFNGNNTVSLPWHWSMMPKRVEELSRAVPLLRTFPEVTDDELLAILHRLYQETIYCRLAMKRWIDKRHNGGKSYIVAVTHAGKLLEDFNVTDEWGAYCATSLAQYITTGFYPDGQCVEMATSYSGNACYSVQELASLLTSHEGIKAARPRLAAMVDWSIGLSLPTGKLPSFGDLSARHVSGTIYQPLLGWLDVPYAKTILTRTPGPLPPSTDWPAPGKDSWCGYYVMRSDWTPEALYLCLSAGPWGTSGHEHGDKLSFVVTAHGQDFIIDPTSTSYRNNEPDAFVSVQAASFLHNTVTIDGVDEFINGPTEAKAPLKNPWEHGPHHTFVEGSYSFAPAKPVSWKRRIVFADKAYWLVQDVLTGTQESAAVEQNFQFEMGVEIEFDGARTIAKAPNGARLLIVPLDEKALKPAMSLGDEQPHTTWWPDGKPKPNNGIKADSTPSPHGRGWTGRTGKKLLPAPAVTYTGTVKVPAMITLAIIPLGPKADPAKWPSITSERGGEASPDATIWKLPIASGTLRVETSPNACKVSE
ncbi:MAG: alginate lyase family protein [Planctomycetota bacterium]|nr:alginate lyase family protein [Planctomycetota bacterium]